MSHTRLLITAAGVSLFLIVLGLVREGTRFGWSGDALPKLRAELSARVAEKTRLVQTTAARVARQSDLVAAAGSSADRLAELFNRMNEPLPINTPNASATVWINAGGAVRYRPLAWTDGPAEQIPIPDLDRGKGLLVITSASGLRLIALEPILRPDGTRIGVAAAETLLSSVASITSGARPLIHTSVGLLPIESISGPVADSVERLVLDVDSQPLLAVEAPLAQIAASRQSFHWRWIAIAAIPWAVYIGIALVRLVGRRRKSRGRLAWTSWTAVLVTAAIISTALAAWLLAKVGLGGPGRDAAVALAAFFVASVGPVALWCRTKPRRLRPIGDGSFRFVMEHAAGGGVLLAAVLAADWLWRSRITPASIDQWHLPVLPSNLSSAVGLTSLLLVQIAMLWAAASVLGLLATRWRLPSASGRFTTALLLWIVPSAIAIALKRPIDAAVIASLGVVVTALVLFGFLGPTLRHFYRQGSEVRRLVLQFLALVAPVLCVYPLASAAADRATRDLIETDYAPATQAARQPDRLMDTLTTAWADLDAVTELPQLLGAATGSAANTELAFRIWNRTRLARERVASQIELYGQDHRLVSRFSLNVPEINTATSPSAQRWTNGGCEWDAFSETSRFGAGERNMLHAERALCDGAGRFLGAIVVRIIPDYRTLHFVASANPYYDALGQTDSPRATSRIPELQVVVYGWSLQPLFVSGRVMWLIDTPLFDALYRSRDPFWTDRTIDGRRYHVHFRSDRGGIYAVGYPHATPMQHATRMAESGALLALLFFIYLAATVVTGPVAWRGQPPLERVFAEIRASFTRKLFLFFVVAAVLPVILFAIAFGTYMTSRLRADVESEASSVVLMARRVLDELRAAQTVPGQEPPAATDDLMVWIRQVVDQDVNLFEGAGLHATSQRDLFGSGLLPERTPAGVYRRIALERRPVAVVEDRIGTLRYLVAAVPVQSLGPNAALTVPLASRQREIERQIDELTRGVLAGAVVLVLFAAALGASVAGRVSDPVARLSRATRLVAAGRYDERLAADTADELGRLVEDFNKMIDTLVAQRAELARTNQVRAWAEMARQVAHEIKNPLTPIQLAAEHLQRVHGDAGKPLGPIVEQCLTTVLSQVSLLRRIASEFSTFASRPTARFEPVDVAALVRRVVEPYTVGLPAITRITLETAAGLPSISADRTLLSRALTNLVENALQAMPTGGDLRMVVARDGDAIRIDAIDTGVGMDEVGVERAFEPYFSTKTAGSGLGLANARRNIEMCGGTITLTSAPGRGTTVTVKLPIDRDARGTS